MVPGGAPSQREVRQARARGQIYMRARCCKRRLVKGSVLFISSVCYTSDVGRQHRPTYYLKEIKCLRSQSHYMTVVAQDTHSGLHASPTRPRPDSLPDSLPDNYRFVLPCSSIREAEVQGQQTFFFFFFLMEKSASLIDDLWAKCTSGFNLRKQRPTIRWGKRF